MQHTPFLSRLWTRLTHSREEARRCPPCRSRTVVREALSHLQAAGQVLTRHGIGTFVLEPPPVDLGTATPPWKAGKLNVVAILAQQRYPAAPDVPRVDRWTDVAPVSARVAGPTGCFRRR